MAASIASGAISVVLAIFYRRKGGDVAVWLMYQGDLNIKLDKKK